MWGLDMITVRLVGSPPGKIVQGRVVKVTETVAQVRAPDGLIHRVNRMTGVSRGARGPGYSVHEDDVWLLQTTEADSLFEDTKSKGKKRTQFSNHWEV